MSEERLGSDDCHTMASKFLGGGCPFLGRIKSEGERGVLFQDHSEVCFPCFKFSPVSLWSGSWEAAGWLYFGCSPQDTPGLGETKAGKKRTPWAEPQVLDNRETLSAGRGKA